MKIFPMKTVATGAATLAVVLGLAASGGAAQQGRQGQQGQQQSDYSQTLKELNIMRNIFAASLQEERNNGRGLTVIGGGGFQVINMGDSSSDALYLAGQGMVFTFNVPRVTFRGIGNRNFNFNYSFNPSYWQEFGVNMARIASEVAAEVQAAFPGVDLNVPPSPPAPPALPAPGGLNLDDLREFNEEALEAQQEAIEEMQEALRDRQEDIADLQRDIRDLQRDIRNDRGNADTLQAQIDRLQEQIDERRAEMDTQREAYDRFMTEYEARVEEEVANFNRQFSDMIVTILCDYGATLRSLENNEHVTLIFQNFVGDQDQVYVFDYSDVASCTSAEELLAGAVSYRI